jgi:hypothetical protein
MALYIYKILHEDGIDGFVVLHLFTPASIFGARYNGQTNSSVSFFELNMDCSKTFQHFRFPNRFKIFFFKILQNCFTKFFLQNFFTIFFINFSLYKFLVKNEVVSHHVKA